MKRQQSKESISINIRAKVKQRDLIDLAAEKLGRSRSDFMLDAACSKAEDVLLDQAYFAVTANTFEMLQGLIDQPLPATEKLRLFMNKKAPWER